ncbi:hypothetical protein FA13DRAFT_527112 [Coprinellus micaceus]|uniref:Arrestin-like N-terminal domain-containing protein n=1 Tax=Coprinellus micaceus TaxID=71717 RepID=A0A4Y7T943_COPMI|nr:hypothetical protein FA13DRAFT_527112 [Coprinellus micaceus]
MSTTSLPSYVAPSVNRVPSYSREPAAHEQRLALSERNPGRPSGSFVKQSKKGDFVLQLYGQDEDSSLPVYGTGSIVDGVVEVLRSDTITRIEVKIEGYLKIREIGEGGHSTINLFLEEIVLWSREADGGEQPPSSLPFSFRLPESFTIEDGKAYPLPPTYGVKLSGFPGFTANTDYSVSVLINKPNPRAISSKAMGLIVGTTAITTPFNYRPRTRPPTAIPPPLLTDAQGFVLTPEWTLYESTIQSKQPGLQDIQTKLYVPSTKVFSIGDIIPFHLSLHSTSMSLATYLPLSPTAKSLGSKKPTQVQLMRQSTVDVRNLENPGKLRRDMWIVDCIGEGTITLQADAPSWIAYSGRIRVAPDITIAGFKAAGLSVKDFILFTLNPPEPAKCPFYDLRQAVPIKLTTDAWATPNGAGIGRPPSDHSSEN